MTGVSGLAACMSPPWRSWRVGRMTKSTLWRMKRTHRTAWHKDDVLLVWVSWQDWTVGTWIYLCLSLTAEMHSPTHLLETPWLWAWHGALYFSNWEGLTVYRIALVSSDVLFMWQNTHTHIHNLTTCQLFYPDILYINSLRPQELPRSIALHFLLKYGDFCSESM